MCDPREPGPKGRYRVEGIDSEQATLWEDERAAEAAFAKNSDYNDVRHHVLERDGSKCTYRGCGARALLHVHHIRYRSRGGGDTAWNLTVVCEVHHRLIHTERIGIQGPPEEETAGLVALPRSLGRQSGTRVPP